MSSVSSTPAGTPVRADSPEPPKEPPALPPEMLVEVFSNLKSTNDLLRASGVNKDFRAIVDMHCIPILTLRRLAKSNFYQKKGAGGAPAAPFAPRRVQKARSRFS
ncbi:MAG: F-box-like domain-containing protein [Simkaniaceae bacterium]|nr:F-box-like domain-containing protein [Candidatus Sacchlamyda saccharinae]